MKCHKSDRFDFVNIERVPDCSHAIHVSELKLLDEECSLVSSEGRPRLTEGIDTSVQTLAKSTIPTDIP